MKPYGQFCPLAQAAQLLCERWTLIIIREFIAGSTRFNDLRKGLPLISPTLLSTRLKQLIKAGVIELNSKTSGRTYKLTQAGKELRPVIELMGAWGHRWARSDLNSNDLDAGLLMWDMRRSVDPDIFPDCRVVVQFTYPDAPEGAKDWWLVSENGDIDLCLHDHGHEVDIVINCSLKVMTKIWICEQTFNAAVKKGEISIIGKPELIKRLQEWLKTSPLSKLGTLDRFPTLSWKLN